MASFKIALLLAFAATVALGADVHVRDSGKVLRMDNALVQPNGESVLALPMENSKYTGEHIGRLCTTFNECLSSLQRILATSLTTASTPATPPTTPALTTASATATASPTTRETDSAGAAAAEYPTDVKWIEATTVQNNNQDYFALYVRAHNE